MADAINFMNTYSAQIKSFVDMLRDLETKNQQLTEDPTLVDRYFNPDATHRTDIAPEDVDAAQAAIVQMLFTYNSGSPTQAAALLKMFP
jgi:hypothetical protein